jgi:hypothetical protein
MNRTYVQMWTQVRMSGTPFSNGSDCCDNDPYFVPACSGYGDDDILIAPFFISCDCID